jgi:hypothetical protein
MFNPVAVRPKRFVASIENAISPDPGRYMPEEVSLEKFNGGAPTVPFAKEIVEAPAAIVDALYRLTESHNKMTC